VRCHCGQPASWNVAGAERVNAGKAFYGCETFGCGFFKLEEEEFGPRVSNRGGYMDYLSACDEYEYEPDYELTEADLERIKNDDDMMAAMSTLVEDLPDYYYEEAFAAEENRDKGSEEGMDEDSEEDREDYEDYEDYYQY
jgi:hypothetical protein